MINSRPFDMSPDGRTIRQYLRKVLIDEVVTYTKLSELLGRPVTGSTPVLLSAINSLIREDKILFVNIRKIGYQRLPDDKIVAHADTEIDGIRRHAKRAARKLVCISDYERLTPQKQLAHTTKLSIFTMIGHVASDRGIKKVETAAKGRTTELPLAETLKAFEK